MAQVILVGARRHQRCSGRVALLDAAAPRVPRGVERGKCRAVAGIGVERGAMIGGIEQAALRELRLDLDQPFACLAQQADAGRLVVDEGAAPAVGVDDAAQHQRVALARDPGLGEERAHRVVRRQRELRAHHRLLGAGADEAAFRAHAERQPQRVEQDRFAGAGLARQHAQAGPQAEIEPVDQHDIADGEAQ